MMSAADWQRMRDEMAQVRSDRSIDVAFRRAATTLDAQEVRIEAVGRGYRAQSEAARESRTAVVVFGASDLNVQVGDRFNDENGVLFEVVFIAVNRDVDTQAEAVAVQ